MLLILFFSTIVIFLVLTYIIEKTFLKYSLFIDEPKNRSTHLSPTPTAGGLSIIISFFIYIVALLNVYDLSENVFFYLLIALIPIVIIGLTDDFKEINVLTRLFVQFFSASLIIYYFQISNNFFDTNEYSQKSFLIIILSIILSMWLMNLYNFMDGIDGYASAECIFVTFSAGLIAYINDPSSLVYMFLIGLGLSNIGFLFRNWYPAKIFMGDTGSVSIGCILAFFIFYSASQSIISIYTWLILLSIFIADSTYTLVVRIVTKKNITKPHLTHAFHMLAANKNSQLFVVKTMLILNLIWVFPLAILSNIYMEYHILITFLTYSPLIVYLIRIGAGLEYNKSI